MNFKWVHRWATARNFYYDTRYILPVLWIIALSLFAYGFVAGLLYAPADYQQGNAFRMIYVHVPSAFMSLFVYMTMAISAFIALVWRIKLANYWVKAAAPVGAWMTLIALITGSIWGKPMWGTWWIWDARLTSELILFFIYIAYIALHRSFAEYQVADKVGNIFVLVGVVNIPIIHYSVVWWNTLHQGPSLSAFAKPTIAPIMLYPLLALIVAWLFYALAVIILRVRNQILLREHQARWVIELAKRGH